MRAFFLAGVLASMTIAPAGAFDLFDTGPDKWDVDAVAALPVDPDPQRGTLQKALTELARLERDQYDWNDTAYYNSLVRAIAAGELPAPRAVSSRSVAGDVRLELEDAEAHLADLLGRRGAQLRAPEELGEMQAAFECWLEQAEEGHQIDQIDACREKFGKYAAIVAGKSEVPGNIVVILPEDGGKIGGVTAGDILLDQPFAAAGLDGAPTSVPVFAEEIEATFQDAIESQPEKATHYQITFETGSTRLGDGAEEVFEAIAADVNRRVIAEVEVEGHADTVGGAAINQQISIRRAQAVAAVLKRRLTGDTVTILVFGAGEDRLLVDTPDNTDEEQNRRVSIEVR